MKLAGENTLHAPVEKAWDALLDPAVLVRTIPGCERLEALPSEEGENAYAMTVTAGVAAIRGTYTGTCVLSDLVEHESLVMTLQGAGAPGTIGATVAVGFSTGDSGSEATAVSWEADAVVGGMVGGVGQRMLTSVSKRMAGEFFGNVDDVLSGAGAPGTAEADSGVVGGGTPQVYTDSRPSQAGSQREFLAGAAVGAALVALGVVLGRRR